jgi:hypothetical protein
MSDEPVIDLDEIEEDPSKPPAYIHVKYRDDEIKHIISKL